MTKVDLNANGEGAGARKRTRVSGFAAVIAALALLLAAAGRPAEADNALSEAGKFVERLGEKVITQLTPKDISEAERVKRMRALLNEAFDVPAVGQFVLGFYWRRASAEERAEFLELYETVVAHTYAGLFRQYSTDLLEQYSGEVFTITGERPMTGGGTVVYGRIAKPYAEPILVELRVKRSSSGHKAVDIKIEGVSISLTHRKEFFSVIQRRRGGVEGLLDVLRKKVAVLEGAVPVQLTQPVGPGLPAHGGPLREAERGGISRVPQGESSGSP